MVSFDTLWRFIAIWLSLKHYSIPIAIIYVFILSNLCHLTNSIEVFETDGTISHRVWNSMGDHVINDLQYLKSLATSIECKQKIEDTYIQHVSYSVVRKEDSYSFDLQNLCPNKHKTKNASIANNNTKLFIQKYINEKPYEYLRIVYFIMMHQNPYQVIRLISNLNTSLDLFLVHIDKKTANNVSSIITQFAEFHSNVHLTEQQEVTWGGFSIIDVQLDAMKYAIQCLKFEFDFFMILSESDYPLVSINKIKYFLNKYRGKTIMRKLKPLNNKKIQPFLQDVYCECDNLLYHVGRREINENNGIIIYSSSLWATYDYKFVKFIVEDDEIIPDYIDFFRPTAVSDETFFATLLMNSPLCDNYVKNMDWNTWRLELWPFINTDKNLLPCKHDKSNTAFCGIGPIDIISDYLPVLQSTKALFARKFNPTKDTKVLNIIDDWRNNSIPKLLKNHKLITIAVDNQCLSVIHDDYDDDDDPSRDAFDLDVDECIGDELQTFMLSQCTEEIYLNDNKCLQSKKQFGNKAFAICEIRGIIRNNEGNLDGSNERCLSILQTVNGVKSGTNIVINKCLNDGFTQKFYFNECSIKYASPLLNYLKNEDQNLCLGFCEEYRLCLKSCNITNTNVITHISV